MNNKDILNFIFEMGMLSRIKHEGWRTIKVDNPKSVADHCTRAAQIGYLLAKMEGFENPELVATMLVFHDIGECRIGDLHKISSITAQRRSRQNQLKSFFLLLKIQIQTTGGRV